MPIEIWKLAIFQNKNFGVLPDSMVELILPKSFFFISESSTTRNFTDHNTSNTYAKKLTERIEKVKSETRNTMEWISREKLN